MKALMVAPALFIYLFGFSQIQDSANADSPIFGMAERQPEFPGGQEKFIEYTKLHMRNIEMSIGRIIVEFVVEIDGTLSNIIIAKGLCPTCDAEAIRVMQNSPKWIPGRNAGKKVRVRYAETLIY